MQMTYGEEPPNSIFYYIFYNNVMSLRWCLEGWVKNFAVVLLQPNRNLRPHILSVQSHSTSALALGAATASVSGVSEL